MSKVSGELKVFFSNTRTAPPDLDKITSIDEFMRLLTGDNRWANIKALSGNQHTDIFLKPEDPAVYAILRTISNLPDCKKSRDPEPGPEDNFMLSVRSYMKVPEKITLIAWLKPHSMVLNKNTVAILEAANNPRVHDVQIRILADMDYMKKHFIAMQKSYTSAYSIAKHNNLHADTLLAGTEVNTKARGLSLD